MFLGGPKIWKVARKSSNCISPLFASSIASGDLETLSCRPRSLIDASSIGWKPCNDNLLQSLYPAMRVYNASTPTSQTLQTLCPYSRSRLSTMYFSMIFVTTALFVTSLIAIPTSMHESKRAFPCSGLESHPQCCAVNVLNLADLQCEDRTTLSLFSMIPCSRRR